MLGCLEVTQLKTLKELQNRATRIVTKSTFGAPAMALIHISNWPTLSDIIGSETAANTYESQNGLVHECLSHVFVKSDLKMSETEKYRN